MKKFESQDIKQTLTDIGFSKDVIKDAFSETMEVMKVFLYIALTVIGGVALFVGLLYMMITIGDTYGAVWAITALFVAVIVLMFIIFMGINMVLVKDQEKLKEWERKKEQKN